MNTFQIATTHNGTAIYVDLLNSEAAARISRQPHLATLIKEIVTPLTLTKPTVSIEHSMGRVIGNTEIVETADSDVVVYAKKLHSDTYTRFVKNRKLKPTSHLTILLKRDRDANYELIDTWFGHMAPPPPGKETAASDSADYWSRHAVVLDGQLVQRRTLTKDCPY